MTKHTVFLACWLGLTSLVVPSIAQNPAAFSSIRLGTSGDEEFVVRNADNSAYAAVVGLYLRYGSGSPEGAESAPVGAIYHRTDGGTNTSLYIKQSGSGNTGWAAVTP